MAKPTLRSLEDRYGRAQLQGGTCFDGDALRSLVLASLPVPLLEAAGSNCSQRLTLPRSLCWTCEPVPAPDQPLPLSLLLTTFPLTTTPRARLAPSARCAGHLRI